ncbi:MAG: signal peptidase I [Candidatus Nezhaarchaeales archaeon]
MAKIRRDIIVLVVIIIAIFAFNEGVKIVVGTDVPLAIVEGNSMIPTFYDGDIIFVVGVKPSDLQVGDVIIYRANDKLIVHRIIDIIIYNGKYFFKTKGDNNLMPDPGLVPEDRVVGRVVGVLLPRVGAIFKLIMPYKYVIVGLLIVLAVAIVLWPSKKDEGRELLKTQMVKFKRALNSFLTC